MRVTKQLDEHKKHLLKDYIQQGYNNLVLKSNTIANAEWHDYTSLKDSSGKFSLFAFFDQGHHNLNHGDSIWNSAFMAQLFLIGRSAAPMDDRYVHKLLNYVKSKQAADGSFHDNVPIAYYDSHKTSSKVPLTAYTISTFLKYEHEQYSNEVDTGINFLRTQVPKTVDYFELAITAYTLSLHSSIKRSEHIDRNLHNLISYLITESDEYENKMFWQINKNSRGSSKVEAVQIETASYVLLAMMNCHKNIEYYMNIIFKINNWLYLEISSISGSSISHEKGDFFSDSSGPFHFLT